MKVLIVDDNKNNRMILNLLLEDYEEEHSGVSFDVSEVEDGKQAVDNVKENKYDLIFMDIMMPVMDGIEATALIHRLDKTVMIIAVSAVDDNERKKVILSNGAEDYISKPVNADIFEARLNSYIKLIESRKTPNTTIAEIYPHNLFDKNIYSYEVHFNGPNEDALAYFWEHYLLKDTPYDGLSDMVRFIFDMSLTGLEHGRVDIFEENNDEMLYLTIRAQKEFDADSVMFYADKCNFMEDYKLEGKVLSAKLKKEKVMVFIEPKVVHEEPVAVVEPESEPVAIQTSVEVKEDVVYDILDADDFEDLKDYISKLNSLLLILGSSVIEDYEVEELVMTMLQISKSISSYTELYKIGAALGNLGMTINEHKESFIEKSLEIGPLAVAFGGDLSHWFKSLFITGASSVDFLDDSIVSNASMIESFINPKEQEDASDDMDDIFDF